MAYESHLKICATAPNAPVDMALVLGDNLHKFAIIGRNAVPKPTLHFWQIWNMCFGFFGIQVGFGLQNANVSRIFQTLGADVETLPILWIAAPLTGLLVQPIIGHMSDRTWGRLGRRRPYFFYGALATTAALLVMPNSPVLWVAAGMLWVMDASINVTMEPFRAFVGDMLPHRQRTAGFAAQSFFIGSGAVLASAAPWMLANWFSVSNTAAEGIVPPSVKIAFYFGAVFVLGSVMWTVFTTTEYSSEELREFEESEASSSPGAGAGHADRQSPNAAKYIWIGAGWLLCGAALTAVIAEFGLEKELYILSIGGAIFGLMQIGAALLKRRGWTENAFSEIISDLFLMPGTMRRLAVVQFFSWFALFSMWIYTTSAVTAHIYGTRDPTSLLYNKGADWVGVLFATYNGVAALAAFAIPFLAAWTSRKTAHIICLVCGGVGLVSFLLIRDPAMLLLSMVGIGIAWASILSLPYAILSGALPSGKMGVYMGIFNFFIVIPQLTAASILGAVVRDVFGGEAIYALALGGLSMGLAAIATIFVEDPTGARLVQRATVPAPARGH
jgi:maltose/moltooligosaccharide transporter